MLNIGDQLIIELKYSDKQEKFKCKVVELKENRLYIDYPINLETNRTTFFIDGTEIKCSFVGKDNSVYLFESEVKGRVKQIIPMIVLSYPEKDQLVKIQRREYVRVETSVDVAVHSLHGEFRPFVTITDDISAGGAAIITSNRMNFEKDMVIKVWIVLPMQNGEYHYFSFESIVVRILPHDQERNKISIQFLDVAPHERQVLLRYCFDTQVAMRKKGLLNK